MIHNQHAAIRLLCNTRPAADDADDGDDDDRC